MRRFWIFAIVLGLAGVASAQTPDELDSTLTEVSVPLPLDAEDLAAATGVVLEEMKLAISPANPTIEDEIVVIFGGPAPTPCFTQIDTSLEITRPSADVTDAIFTITAFVSDPPEDGTVCVDMTGAWRTQISLGKLAAGTNIVRLEATVRTGFDAGLPQSTALSFVVRESSDDTAVTVLPLKVELTADKDYYGANDDIVLSLTMYNPNERDVFVENLAGCGADYIIGPFRWSVDKIDCPQIADRPRIPAGGRSTWTLTHSLSETPIPSGNHPAQITLLQALNFELDPSLGLTFYDVAGFHPFRWPTIGVAVSGDSISPSVTMSVKVTTVTAEGTLSALDSAKVDVLLDGHLAASSLSDASGIASLTFDVTRPGAEFRISKEGFRPVSIFSAIEDGRHISATLVPATGGPSDFIRVSAFPGQLLYRQGEEVKLVIAARNISDAPVEIPWMWPPSPWNYIVDGVWDYAQNQPYPTVEPMPRPVVFQPGEIKKFEVIHPTEQRPLEPGEHTVVASLTSIEAAPFTIRVSGETAPSGEIIRGQVSASSCDFCEDYQLVLGAKITAFPAWYETARFFAPPQIWETETDSSGRYELPWLPLDGAIDPDGVAGEWIVSVRAEHYRAGQGNPAIKRVRLGTEPASMNFHLIRDDSGTDDIKIEGTVTASWCETCRDFMVVPGALVSAVPADSIGPDGQLIIVRTRTDERGRYSLNHLPESAGAVWTVMVRADGFRLGPNGFSKTVELMEGHGKANFHLIRMDRPSGEGKIVGRVSGSSCAACDDHIDVVRAHVTAVPQWLMTLTGFAAEQVWELRTDAEGRFVLDHLPISNPDDPDSLWDVWIVRIHHPEFVATNGQDAAVVKAVIDNDGTAEIAVHLLRRRDIPNSTTISGIVSGQRSTMGMVFPIAEADVWAQPLGTDGGPIATFAPGFAPYHSKTASDGSYKLANLPSTWSRWLVTASKEGFEPVTKKVAIENSVGAEASFILHLVVPGSDGQIVRGFARDGAVTNTCPTSKDSSNCVRHPGLAGVRVTATPSGLADPIAGADGQLVLLDSLIAGNVWPDRDESSTDGGFGTVTIKTDDEGRYKLELPQLPIMSPLPISWRIHFHIPDYRSQNIHVTPDRFDDRDVATVSVVMEPRPDSGPANAIVGTVTSTDGSAVERAEVVAFSVRLDVVSMCVPDSTSNGVDCPDIPAPILVAKTRTAEDGTYHIDLSGAEMAFDVSVPRRILELADLPGWWVAVRKPGFEPARVSVADNMFGGNGVATVDFALTPAPLPDQLTIEGRVWHVPCPVTEADFVCLAAPTPARGECVAAIPAMLIDRLAADPYSGIELARQIGDLSYSGGTTQLLGGLVGLDGNVHDLSCTEIGRLGEQLGWPVTQTDDKGHFALELPRVWPALIDSFLDWTPPREVRWTVLAVDANSGTVGHSVVRPQEFGADGVATVHVSLGPASVDEEDNEVQLRIGHVVASGDTVDVPIRVKHLRGYNVISLDLDLAVDPTRLKAVNVLTRGGLAENWLVRWNVEGEIIPIALAGDRPLAQPVVRDDIGREIELDGIPHVLEEWFGAALDAGIDFTSADQIQLAEITANLPPGLQAQVVAIFDSLGTQGIPGHEVEKIEQTARDGYVVAWIRFALVGQNPGASHIRSVSASLNEGAVPVEVHDGTVTTGRMGDPSGNGEISAFDAAQTLRLASRRHRHDPLLEQFDPALADVSGDGAVNAYDAALMLEYRVGNGGGFPGLGEHGHPIRGSAGARTERIKDDGTVVTIVLDGLDVAGVIAADFTLGFDHRRWAILQITPGAGAADFVAVGDTVGGTLEIALAGPVALNIDGELVIIRVVRLAPDGADKPAAGDELGLPSLQRLSYNGIQMGITAIGGQDATAEVPGVLLLEQNRPNPFNPTTTIGFGIPQNAANQPARLSVYNMLGQEVTHLELGRLTAGYHRIQWYGRSDAGLQLANGVYFYQINVGSHRMVKRMLLIR